MKPARVPEFAEAQRQSALTQLKSFEEGYLGMRGYLNPFRRPGMVASDVAYTCGLLKEGESAAGRQKVDTPAARRLLKLLIQEGLVEAYGAFRTLAAGSTSKDCFVLKGFSDRLSDAQADFSRGRN